jgi:predicted permease
MRSLRRFLARLWNFAARRNSDRRLREELEMYVRLEVEGNRRAGMTPAEARRQALLKLGPAQAVRESYHAEASLPLLETVLQDCRYAIRVLRKSPVFTAVAVLTLALGIGANAAVFSLLDSLFLKPLPLPHPEQLVRIYAKGPSGHYGAGFSMLEFENLRNHARSFTALAAEDRIAQLNLITSDGSSPVSGAFVSGNYFDIVGVQPRFGRAFLPEEDAVPNRNAVAVISDALWKTHFHSDTAIAGRQIRVNGTPFTVIGVAPAGFHGDLVGSPEEIWIPAMMLGKGGFACADSSYNCSVIDAVLGRLAPGIPATQAQAELTSDIVWTATDWPERPSRRQAVLLPARAPWPESLADQNAHMQLLEAVTGSLLLIACANLAGLLLARGAARKREVAVRLAIGARRARVIRQFLTENLLLSAMGGAVGLGLSFAMKGFLARFYQTDSEGFHHLYDVSFDWRVLIYTGAVTFLTGIFFGVLPAIWVSRQDLNAELKQSAPAATPISGRLGDSLVVGQVALCVVLVVSTGLLVRSGMQLERGTNFDPAHVVVLRLRPELLKYTPQQVQALVLESTRRIRENSQVQSVAFMQGGEGLVWNWQNGREAQVAISGAEAALAHTGVTALKQDIGPGFFRTLRTPLLQGREFDSGDRAGSPRVAIVNETLATGLWPQGMAVGRTLIVNGVPHRVVGITANLQPRNVLHGPEPHLYLSYWQSGSTQEGDVRLAIRVSGDAASALTAIRRTIRSIDPAVPIGEDMLMSEQVDLEYMPVLLARSVMSYCGVLALCLGAIGIYSLLAFAVRARTREIGIRIAVGARKGDVIRMILRQGVRLTFMGVFIGLGAAVCLTRLEGSLLYGVRATDPFIFAFVTIVLFVSALVASLLPARRAASIDPTMALRAE